MPVKNLKGLRFGRLRVVDFSHVGADHKAVWLCACDCGQYKTTQGTSLSMGWTQSCGCIGVEKARKRPYEAIYNKLIVAATKRDLFISLSYEDFVTLTKVDKCHYCHAEVKWSKHHGQKLRNQAYNLDRADNSLGYERDNLVVCCRRCNMGKRDLFSYDEWFGMTEYLRKQNESITGPSSGVSLGEDESLAYIGGGSIAD